MASSTENLRFAGCGLLVVLGLLGAAWFAYTYEQNKNTIGLAPTPTVPGFTPQPNETLPIPQGATGPAIETPVAAFAASIDMSRCVMIGALPEGLQNSYRAMIALGYVSDSTDHVALVHGKGDTEILSVAQARSKHWVHDIDRYCPVN